MPEPQTVFISWAHEGSNELKMLVVALANRLCNEGLDTMVDLYVGTTGPPEGWPLWCERQITQRRFVVVVCSERCRRRYDGNEDTPGVGLGLCYEAFLARQQIYSARSINERYIPVFLRETDRGCIPQILSAANRYDLFTAIGYERLYRHLTNQPEFERPPIGKLRDLAVTGTPSRTASTVVNAPLSGVPTDVSNASQVEGDTPVDREINAIMEPARSGRHAKAIQQLEDMRKLRWADFDSRIRFRVLANLGTIFAADGEGQKAAALFKEAHGHQPNRRRAQVLLATAHMLVDDLASAYSLSSRLCEEQSDDPTAQAVRIRSAPRATSLATLESSVPANLQNDREVLLAMFNRAGDTADLAAAETYANRMISASPEDPQPRLALGTLILQTLVKELRGDLSLTPTAPERVQLERAESALSEAERLWGDRDKDTLLASLYRNRAAARRFLGKTSESLKDSKTAFDIDPSDPECRLNYALELDLSGNDAEAVKVIESGLASAPTPRARLLMAIKLQERGKEGDTKLAAASLFEGLGQVHTLEINYRDDWLWVLVGMLCDLNELPRAREVIAVAAHSGISGGALELLRAVVARAAGDSVSEATALDQCLSTAQRESDHLHLQRLCDRLEIAGRFADALRVYQMFCRLDRLTVHTRPMLQCAQKAGEHKFVMQTLGELRAAGQIDASLLHIEGQLSEQYREYDRLAEVLMAGARMQPSDAGWKLRLAHLAIDRGRPEWAPHGVDWLPTAMEAAVAIGAMAAALLAKRGERAKAAQYAYTLHRRFPGEPAPASVLIGAVFMPGRSLTEFSIPERVGPGTAVRYQSISEQVSKTVVIEDEAVPPPSPDRGELAPDHLIAKALIGLKIGDSFNEPAPFAERPCRVTGVFDKVVYRANVLAAQWQQRHPEIPLVQEFRAGESSNDAKDPKAILGEAFQELEKHSKLVEDLDRLYSERSAPLPMVAKRAGWSVLQAAHHMVYEAKAGIVCCVGSTEERAKALRDVRSVGRTNGIVVEPTALATLFMLDQAEVLAKLPSKPLVAESAIEDVRRSLIEMSTPDGEAARVGITDGQLRMTVMKPDDVAAWNGRIGAFIAKLRALCTVQGGGALMGLPAAERADLQKWFPPATVDSLAIAFGRGALLWCDDLMMASINRNQWGHASVWTMAVFMALQELECIDAKLVASVGVSLNIWDFQFTGVSPNMVVEALAKDLWDASKPGSAKVLSRVIDENTPARNGGMFVGQVCKAIRDQAPSSLAARQATDAVLSRVNARVDSKQIRVLLLSIADSLFGLDVVGAQHFKEAVRQSGPEGPPPPSGLLIPDR